jgi:mono/diheme cytochrome c family protein
MNLTIEIKGVILGLAALIAMLGLAWGGGVLSRSGRVEPPGVGEELVKAAVTPEARRGLNLYANRCARCHGDDARGDDGPDLRGLTKSDARLALIIRNGVKGKMPKFGAKLTEPEVAALIAFMRVLPD